MWAIVLVAVLVTGSVPITAASEQTATGETVPAGRFVEGRWSFTATSLATAELWRPPALAH